MTVYIDPFFGGVIVTIVAEAISLVIYAIAVGKKRGTKK